MVKVIHKVSMMARVGMTTMPIEVEDMLVEMELRVVEVAVRVVLTYFFMQF